MKFLFGQLGYLLSDRTARRNLTGFFQYLAFLTAVILAFAVLFHFVMQYEGRYYSWVTGLYWVLTVMSTLGFGDITFESDLGRLYSIVVLLSGIVLLIIVLPFAFIRYFYAPWLEAQIHARAPRAVPAEVSNHILICNWDPIARGLAERLTLLHIPYFVIESDPTKAANLLAEGVPVVAGDLEAATTYVSTRAAAARAIFVNLDDARNTNITITIREHAPTTEIIATTELSESLDVMRLAGATHILPLKQRLGEQLASRVNAGHCEAHVVGRFKDLLIAEFPVHRTPLAGCTIRDTQLRKETGVNVVAVWERGKLISTRPDTQLSDRSVPVVVGTEQQLGDLNQLIELFDMNHNPVVVIGGGRVGRAAIGALKAKGVPVHLVEHDPAAAARCEGLADQIFVGEGAERELLERAGISKAPSVLLTTHDDAINIYLCIYCRRLNPDLRIVSRITHERNVESIHRAGADFVLSYASLGRESVLAQIQQRELIFVGEGVQFFSFKVPQTLAGKTLRDSEIGARTGLNVIAIQEPDRLNTNPAADTALDPSSDLLVIGNAEQRRKFGEVFDSA